jgi:anthranilate synthase component 1
MIKNINPGSMTCLSLEMSSISDPISFFDKFAASSHSLLLMSSEIDTKKRQESLIILESSVKIVAHANFVELNALTINGEDLILHLAESFSKEEVRSSSKDSLEISFIKSSSKDFDEDQRLKEAGPFTVIRKLITLIKCLQEESDLFIGGNFSFDFLETFEELPEVNKSATSCPYFTLYISQLLVKVDHATGKSKLKACVFGGSSYQASYNDYSRKMDQIKKENQERPCVEENIEIKEAHSKIEYETSINDNDFGHHVKNIVKRIVAGDIFQAVLSRTFKMPCPDALRSFRFLVELNPSPYMFYMRDEGFQLFGASPESALKFTSVDRKLSIYPIAGTRRRGLKESGEIDLDLDGRLEIELRMCQKEVAEHMMLVDLARNDVAKVSVPGSRYVAPLMKVDRYSRVMHLVSQVNGTLRKDLDALHAYQATMNMGTLTGAPKISAVSIIREIEKEERGPYGGAIGYITGKGDFDTCIVIRSAFIKNKMAFIQAGAGVVYDSDPVKETIETKDKAHAVLKAIHLSQEKVWAK